LLYANPFWRGFINAEETNRLQSILNKTIRRSYLPHDFKSLDELLDSADHAMFHVIVRNPHHVLHPLGCAKELFKFTQTYPWINYQTSLFYTVSQKTAQYSSKL